MRTELPRQMVHLSGLVFVILAQFVGRDTTIIFFSLIALFFLLYSLYVRTQESRLERFLDRIESRFRDFIFRFERKDVRNPFTGAMFFYIGCTLAFVFFPFAIASAACAMLAIGDSLSTLVGKKFGRHRIRGKTFEGSAACFFGSLLAGVFFVNPILSFAGALASSAAELFPKINDNLTIPIVSGSVMLLVSLV